MVSRRGLFKIVLLLSSAVAVLASAPLVFRRPLQKDVGEDAGAIMLPKPPPLSASVEYVLEKRRSIRDYSTRALDQARFSQLLFYSFGAWNRGYGVFTDALDEIDVYLVVGAGRVEGLSAGVYIYLKEAHALQPLFGGDYLRDLALAAVSQKWVEEACFNIVLFTKSGLSSEPPEGVVELPHLCAGILGERVYLASTGLGLGCVVIGAFYEDMVRRVCRVSGSYTPLYVIPVGETV